MDRQQLLLLALASGSPSFGLNREGFQFLVSALAQHLALQTQIFLQEALLHPQQERFLLQKLLAECAASWAEQAFSARRLQLAQVV
ncbi:MAG: hypothetical protein WB445_02700 [Acinetobacter sp.]